MTIYKYPDSLFAEEFEGVLKRYTVSIIFSKCMYNFTEEEWSIVRSMQIPLFLPRLSSLSRKILSLRYIFPILELMKSRMGQDYNKELLKTFGTPKFLLFSSHDYQLSHIMKFLNSENLQLEHIEFASVLIFELYRRDTRACKDSSEDACFYVKVLYNDVPLKFPGCSSIDCSFNEFRGYIESFDMTYDQMIEICFSEELLDIPNYEELVQLIL